MTANARKITPLGSIKRDQILRAAESEFERYGYGGARMQRIADTAGVPKANVHYYFANKLDLYEAVLSNVVSLWNQALPPINAYDNPAEVLESYVRMKVEFTRLYPAATRIFALELLNDAPHLSDALQGEIRQWTNQLAEELRRWIKQKKILPLDPYHLIYLIWSSTQHFAVAESQIKSLHRKKKLGKKDHEQMADSLSLMVLRICGLESN